MKPAPRKPTKTSIKTLRRLFDLIDESDLTYRETARRMGIAYATLAQWKNGENSPLLLNLENALQVIGYKLDIVPIEAVEAEPAGVGAETPPPSAHVLGRVLVYLEGSDPKATSGGERNCELRDAVRGLNKLLDDDGAHQEMESADV